MGCFRICVSVVLLLFLVISTFIFVFPPLPSQPLKQFKLSDGRVLSYDEYGQGIPVVYYYGSPSCGDSIWADLFGSGIRFIIPEREGYHGTAVPDLPPSFPRFVGDVEQLLDSLGVTNYYVVGASGGSQPTIHQALRAASASSSRLQGAVVLVGAPTSICADKELGPQFCAAEDIKIKQLVHDSPKLARFFADLTVAQLPAWMAYFGANSFAVLSRLGNITTDAELADPAFRGNWDLLCSSPTMATCNANAAGLIRDALAGADLTYHSYKSELEQFCERPVRPRVLFVLGENDKWTRVSREFWGKPLAACSETLIIPGFGHSAFAHSLTISAVRQFVGLS